MLRDKKVIQCLLCAFSCRFNEATLDEQLYMQHVYQVGYQCVCQQREKEYLERIKGI
jgi:hypothetical protein